MKVLALTDHDTLSGIPEALEAARKFGIKIIPGVEISTIFNSRCYSCFLTKDDGKFEGSSIFWIYITGNLGGL